MRAAVEMTPAEQAATLLGYFAEAEGGAYWVHFGKWGSPHRLPDDVDQAAGEVVAAGEVDCVYVRTSTMLADPPAGKRGGAEASHAFVGFYADLDHDEGLHGGSPEGLPLPSPELALELIEELPEPTLVIDTGGGWQVWWMFRKPILRTDEDIDVKAALVRWSDHLHQLGKNRGVHVDEVKDGARVLRVPGTHNHKWRRQKVGDPRRVRVHSHNPAPRYAGWIRGSGSLPAIR